MTVESMGVIAGPPEFERYTEQVRRLLNLRIVWRKFNDAGQDVVACRFVAQRPGMTELVVASGVALAECPAVAIEIAKAQVLEISARVTAAEQRALNLDCSNEFDDPVMCRFIQDNSPAFGFRVASAVIDTTKAVNDPARFQWTDDLTQYDKVRFEVLRTSTFEVVAWGIADCRREAAASAYCDLVKQHKESPIEGLVLPGETLGD